MSLYWMCSWNFSEKRKCAALVAATILYLPTLLFSIWHTKYKQYIRVCYKHNYHNKHYNFIIIVNSRHIYIHKFCNNLSHHCQVMEPQNIIVVTIITSKNSNRYLCMLTRRYTFNKFAIIIHTWCLHFYHYTYFTLVLMYNCVYLSPPPLPSPSLPPSLHLLCPLFIFVSPISHIFFLLT